MGRIRLAAVAVALAMAVGAPAATATPRPTDPGNGAFGLPGYSVAEEPPHCVGRVCVHWVGTTHDAPPDLSDENANGTPDAIERAADALAAVYARETGAPDAGLGWPAPLADGALGGDDRLDLYLKDMQDAPYGVAPRDDGQSAPTVHGFLEVDRSYAAAAPATLRDVLSHELNHLEQYAYDGYFESWYAEATAEWMMDQVEPEFDNVVNAVGLWAADTSEPLVSTRSSDLPPPKSYGSSVWNLWLARHYGAEVVRDTWAAVAGEPAYESFTPTSFDAALVPRGSSFFDEFVRFSAATAEWRTPDAGFGPSAAGFPDVERVGSLTADGPAATVPLDHTTFALLDVPARRGSELRLHVETPPGLRAGAALVGRSPGGLTAAVRDLPRGGGADVILAGPAAYDRITAVLVNADATRSSPHKDATGQWVFARDAQPLSARLYGTPGDRARAAPSPVTVTAAPPGARHKPPAFRLARPPRASLAALVAGRAVELRLRVARACTIRVELRIDPTSVRALGMRTLVAAERLLRVRPGRRTVQLRLASYVRRRLRDRAIRPSLRARLAGSEADGRLTLVRRSLRLR